MKLKYIIQTVKLRLKMTCAIGIIKKTDNIKYLGIIFDQHMKWDIQIQNLIIKMRKLNHFYINATKILDKPMLRMVYFTMTQSL